jgi:hypothetical protein
MTFHTGGRETTLRVPRAVAVAVVAAALLFSANSCRLSPVSPVHAPAAGGAGGPGLAFAPGDAPPGPAGRSARDEGAQVPTITRLHGEVKHGTLCLTGDLVVEGDRAGLKYSPSETGGWCLQVFLDTDQAQTGYWRGYEYVVRGTEWDPASRVIVVRRITLEPGYPGGWGPASGAATLRVSRGSFALTIPLGAIGGDDGNLDFALETYATVPCAACPSGCSHWYAADYFGSCSADGRPAPALGPVVLSERPGTWSGRPHTGSSAPGR